MIKSNTKAPLFKLNSTDGEIYSLKDSLGKYVVIYFYPKDDTPGCTAEACSFRDNYSQLLDAGVVILGVSPDSVKRHAKFIEKYDLPFPLIADEQKEIINLYGVWGLKKFMGKEYDGVYRETFIIGQDGRIESIIEKVKTKESAEQVLASIK